MFVLNLKEDYQSGLVVDKNIFFAKEANTLFSEINNVLNAEGVIPDENANDQLNISIDLKIKRLQAEALQDYYKKSEVYNKNEVSNLFALKNGDTTQNFNVNDPTLLTHATNKKYVDNEINNVRNDLAPIDNLTSTSTIKPLSANQGRVLKGIVDTKALMNGDVTQNFNVKTPTLDFHATTKRYVDDGLDTKANLTGDSTILFSVATPVSPNDATTKKYVDDKIAASTVLVEDTLISTSSTNALSANQGRVLKGLVDSKEPNLNKPNNDFDILVSKKDGTRAWVNRVKDSQLLEGKTRASIINEVTNNIVNGADGAYDTLKEIENELKSNDTDIANILTTMATKANKTGDNTINFKVKNPIANDDATTKSYVDAKVSGSVVTIEDTLTSTSTINGLSANQGRLLNNDIQTHKSNTSNPHNVNKAQVGLGNVDNTSDLNKPISTATQNALNLKANKAGDNTINFKVKTPSANDDATTKAYVDAKVSGGATTVENVLTSTSTTNALSANMGKVVNDDLQNHKSATNPHNITKTTVGLGNVDNTSDLNKPISTATQNALNLKANKAGDNTINFKVKNPIANDDAVTKSYVDTKVASGGTTIVDNLTSTAATDALSANQGRVLKGLVDTKANLTGDNTINFKVKDPVANDDAVTKSYVDGKIASGGTTIVDNLTSNVTTDALSANMGRFLKFLVDGKANKTGDNTINFKVKDPVANDDAVTKSYVDGKIASGGVTITDNLLSTAATDALSANQGRVLKGLVDVKANKTGDNTVNFKVKDPIANDDAVTKSYVDGKLASGGVTITDNLLSTAATDALSANQGRVLKGLVDAKEDDLGNPATDGMILSSTTAGVRTWIAPPSGGSSTFASLSDTVAQSAAVSGYLLRVDATGAKIEYTNTIDGGTF